LIPRAVDEALREKGVEPVDTPDIKDVVVEEGQPLKFTASFETVPPIEPGDYASITLTPGAATVDDANVELPIRTVCRHELLDRAPRARGVLADDGDGRLDLGHDAHVPENFFRPAEKILRK